jgi:hypothetical protein
MGPERDPPGETSERDRPPPPDDEDEHVVRMLYLL